MISKTGMPKANLKRWVLWRKRYIPKRLPKLPPITAMPMSVASGMRQSFYYKQVDGQRFHKYVPFWRESYEKTLLIVNVYVISERVRSSGDL